MSAPYRGIHLPLDRWPADDREAWEELFVEGDLLDGAGAACHWAEQTKKTNFKHHARWLGWLDREGLLDRCAAPADRATPERVMAFARDLMGRCSPRTVASALIGLKCVLQRMAPDRDWGWLKDLTNRLDAIAEPSVDRRAEILPLADIFRGAVDDLDRLAARQPMRRRDEIAYRDVLMVALLTTCPIRMRNLLQIEIGTHLRRVGEGWHLAFDGVETKNGQPLCFDLAPELVPWIDLYLEKVRPGFPIGTGCQRLWPGSKGQPLTYQSAYSRIIETTKRLFWVAITPHSFRSIAATALAEASTEDALFARPLLGHRRPETTERFYIKASQLEASRRVNTLVETFARP